MQEFFITNTVGHVDNLKTETRDYVDSQKSEIATYTEDKKTEFQTEMQKFTYLGNFSSGTTYQQWNVVTYNGESYLSLRSDNINRIPNLAGNSSYWGKIATRGVKGDPGIGLVFVGEYNDGQNYSIGQAVNHNQVIYECIMATVGNAPPNATYWRYFLDSKAILVSSTEPNTPNINEMWLDTNVDEQVMKYWNGVNWVSVNAANANTLADRPFSYFAPNQEATTTDKGLLSSSDKTKLNGIATGAEVNTVTKVAGRTGAITLTSSDVGLNNVTNNKQMPIAGGSFTGEVKAQGNTNYTTAQVRNIILSPNDANVSLMQNGEIWFKYE